MKTRTLTRGAAIAAVYVVLTLALAPISFGPLQFRVSELLKPLALFDPALAFAFGLGTGLSNLWSPFGPWDYVAMPIVDALAAFLCWRLRRRPWLSLTLQALVIALGVAIFPLGLGGALPVYLTFPAVAVSQLIILLVAYAVIWKPRREWLEHTFSALN
jgi:uncharacterized membrane protein